MRKLTGYIGALIIVFALMGSILAGYALNVNGSSSVINEYERVTDVSGLYSHSQEPNYIDYNPASNYIGYSADTVAYYSNAGQYLMKKITNASYTLAIDVTSKNYTINGVPGSISTVTTPLLLSYTVMVTHDNGSVACRGYYNATWYDGWVTITANNSEIKIYKNDVLQATLNDNGLKVIYTGKSDNFDYYGINGRNGGNNNNYYAYINSIDDIITYDLVTPRIGDTANSAPINTWGARWMGENRVNNTIASGSMTAPAMFTDFTEIGNGVYRVNANFANFTTDQLGQPVVNRTMEGYFIAYPVSSLTSGLGVNYVDSARVNNYPIETDYTNNQTDINASVDLMAVSATNYLSGNRATFLSETKDNGRYVYNFTAGNVYSYKLSDIFSTLTIPANTNYVKINVPSQLTNDSFYESTYPICEYQTPKTNWAVLSSFGNVASGEILPFNDMINRYAYYYPDTGKCELYNENGVKIGTYPSLGDLYVIFKTNVGASDTVIVKDMNGFGGENYYNYYIGARDKPHMDLTYNTGGAVTTIHYADITKGFSIKSDNTVNVIWDNEYNNGNIQILFRADNASATYHNDITIGDNTISIDYVDNGYSVTLNGGDPVAVGKWRNIVLNMDLRTGELSAIPVRTFNSFTNVNMDTARIVIGDMVNPAPTNTIEWAPTSNSLMFNIYSTAVFMNTYGVVMVNPQLDITEYFTDLNGFYRMRLYNFSVLGSSITVNGVTADVSNNSITIDNQTVQLKDMAITYADGHAYISDNNVNIDLGEIVNNNISMAGAWYFETELLKGYTSQKMVYTWDWGDFILNNTQFCVMYIGIALVALMIARRYCSLSITDYIVLIVSFAIALTVQVIA